MAEMDKLFLIGPEMNMGATHSAPSSSCLTASTMALLSAVALQRSKRIGYHSIPDRDLHE